MPTPQNLTDTTDQNVFPVSLPGKQTVTIQFNTDASRPGMTLFTLPEGTTWAPMPHWYIEQHESHNEHLYVVKGRATLLLDGLAKTITAVDGVQTVNKFVVHAWMRADIKSSTKDPGDVVVEEWTDPDDGSKAVFFRNMLGVFEDISRYWRTWMVVQLFLTSDTYDNYASMLPIWTPWWLRYGLIHALHGLARGLGNLMGLSPWYTSYTPVGLRGVAASKVAGGEAVKKTE